MLRGARLYGPLYGGFYGTLKYQGLGNHKGVLTKKL